MHSMGSLWENRTRDLYLKKLGPAELDKRLSKSSKNTESGLRALLALVEPNKAKKMVANCSRNILRRCHGVGGVGYAVVQGDDRIPKNDFFIPGRRFRLRLRHSNVNCDDDAAACQREVAIKFADRNEDGPLDLILFTGRTALARNRKELEKVLELTKANDIRAHCFQDPNYYFSLVDALRRAPSSFAHLVYHSQMPYQFTPQRVGSENRVVRFRLIPGGGGDRGGGGGSETEEEEEEEATAVESGLADDGDQEQPWEAKERRANERRDPSYLRTEFVERLRRDEPIRYILQMQLAPATDHAMWNPQKILDENLYPWIDVMKIELTTLLPSVALRQTYFNVIAKPTCLQFPSSSSPTDPYSYQRFWTTVYTEFELKRKRQMSDDADDDVSADVVRHDVTIQTKALRDGRLPPVDVYVTLAGTKGRSTPRQLTKTVCQSPRDGRDTFQIETDDVGELLAVIVSVKYRQLADDWYLQSVVVSDASDRALLHYFPCHSVVLSKTTLRRGEACLAHKQSYEIHRQERLLDLSEKRLTYTWLPATAAAAAAGGHAFPAQIKERTVQDLPPHELQRANKFNGMLWQVDQMLIDFFQNLRHSMTITSRSADLGRPVNATNGGGSSSTGASSLRRQMSLDGGGGGGGGGATSADVRRRTAMMRQLSVDVNPIYEQDNDCGGGDAGENIARSRWKKIRRHVKTISEAKLPEGSKADMCREIANDVEFARIFVGGINPTMIRRCRSIPDNFPVTGEMISVFLDRRKTLEAEMADGRVYIVDYALLDKASPVHRDADHRYMAAPIVLLYVRSNGDLVPLAVQLNQAPGPTNPVWTPNDRPEQWMLVKLWVRCADFHWGFAVAHFFRCHVLMEPFAVATMRHLSSAHPVYKLLKPHLRYTIATNTLMRTHVFKKDGLVDKYTSLGLTGCQSLMARYWKERFSFSELDPLVDFRTREVDDDRKLPNYFYRDDSVRLWTCLRRCCGDLLGLFYGDSDDVRRDGELNEWLRELNDVGFPDMSEAQRSGLPRGVLLGGVDELADLVAKVVFTLTCQHSATHSDAMDYHGFVPDIPAMMRLPPPDGKDYVVDRDVLTKTLPDQFPDAYFGTLAFVLNIHKPDENNLCVCDEEYFVEPEARAIIQEFRKSLVQITTTQRARNIIAGFLYENLMPAFIPTSAEPLPYVPRATLRKALKGLGANQCRDILFGNTSPSVPLMTLPLCRQFARTLGGRSTTSRRLTMAIVKGLRDSNRGRRNEARSSSSSSSRPIENVREAEEEEEEDDDDEFYADCDYLSAKWRGARGTRLNSSNF